jgi:uncharacterized membrane protein YtjA (UPF0391 family)
MMIFHAFPPQNAAARDFPTVARRTFFRCGDGIHPAVACAAIPLCNNERKPMLSYAVTFLIIALIAAVLGFGGIAGTAIGIAKILFFVFLVLFLISAVMHVGRGRRI